MTFETNQILILILNPIIMIIGSVFLIRTMKIDFTKFDNFPDQIKRVRPHSCIFGIVWIILYTLIGLSWAYDDNYLSYESFIIYIILDLLLLLWLPVNNTNTRYGNYIINLASMMSIYAYTHGDKKSKYCIIPLLSWLFLAKEFNYTIALNDEQNNEKTSSKSATVKTRSKARKSFGF